MVLGGGGDGGDGGGGGGGVGAGLGCGQQVVEEVLGVLGQPVGELDVERDQDVAPGVRGGGGGGGGGGGD